ncbi:TIGR02301 family protein [uncultured Devosia sp.]|uniref:TIGR02301 family protein n=1 Tax=uncultured Devosia sp. TaxID=211434 RepID=UPI00262527F1|nr:TIGR02301 family protein [uncultured Devosia sp.]
MGSSSPSPLWGRIKGGGLRGILLALLLATPAHAIDPLYQRQMERLTEIMGSLYFLEPLCGNGQEDWRQQAAELIDLDEPDDDRRQRLAGAFNTGYTAFARLHRQCTPSSREALARLLDEARRLARDIHTRFAE